jgi:hypothetical protein
MNVCNVGQGAPNLTLIVDLPQTRM